MTREEAVQQAAERATLEWDASGKPLDWKNAEIACQAAAGNAINIVLPDSHVAVSRDRLVQLKLSLGNGAPPMNHEDGAATIAEVLSQVEELLAKALEEEGS